MLHGLGQRFAEFFKVLFVQKDLVFLVLVFTNSFALGDGDIEVFFGLRGLHIEEVGPFSGTHALRENLVFVAIVVIQGLHPPCASDMYFVSVTAMGGSSPRVPSVDMRLRVFYEPITYLLTIATLPVATLLPSSEYATTIYTPVATS